MENKAWKAVSPKHYKEIVPGYQYMHMMMYMLKNPDDHLLGQIYKYLMRLGKKDTEAQELGKSFWYLGFWLLWRQHSDIETLTKTLQEIDRDIKAIREDV